MCFVGYVVLSHDNLQILFRYYGGSSNILSKSGIIGWQPTVAKNPWLFSGELLPITHLIRDSTRKSSMERAINNYIHRALLQEYERLLIAATITYHEEYNTLQVVTASNITRFKHFYWDYNVFYTYHHFTHFITDFALRGKKCIDTGYPSNSWSGEIERRFRYTTDDTWLV